MLFFKKVTGMFSLENKHPFGGNLQFSKALQDILVAIIPIALKRFTSI